MSVQGIFGKDWCDCDIEREKRMCGNFLVKSVRYFVLVNISLKKLIQHFVQRPSGID